jgi:anti-sigma B factor antagonist
VDTPHRLTISGMSGTGAGLAVEGELDAYTAPQLEEALAGVLDQPDNADGTVRLHLGRVAFIDSTGIRAIVRADQGYREAGRRLVIVAPSASVSRLLTLTSLDEHLSIAAEDVAGGSGERSGSPEGGDPS